MADAPVQAGIDDALVTWDHVPGTISFNSPVIGRSLSLRDGALAALLAIVLAGLWWLTSESFWMIAAAIVGSIALVMFMVALLSRRDSVSKVSGVLDGTPAASWEALALRAWARAAVRSTWTWRADPRRGVDEREWFHSPSPSGAKGPRPLVIFRQTSIEFVPGGEELQETVEVGPIRRMTPAERTRRLRQLVWLGIAAVAVGSPLLLGVDSPRLWAAWFIFQALAVVYRMGWAPFFVNSAIASLGYLEVLRLGTRAAFTSQDSVLLVEPAWTNSLAFRQFAQDRMTRSKKGNSLPILVHAVRRDGRIATLTFDNPSDPGLSDLLCRWLETWPPSASQQGRTPESPTRNAPPVAE